MLGSWYIYISLGTDDGQVASTVVENPANRTTQVILSRNVIEADALSEMFDFQFTGKTAAGVRSICCSLIVCNYYSRGLCAMGGGRGAAHAPLPRTSLAVILSVY